MIAGGELEIGRVIHTVVSPGLDACLGIARTQAEWSTYGLELEAEDADGERQRIVTAASPFLIPLSWTIPIV